MRRVFMLLLLLMLLVSPLLAQEESEDYTIHVVQRGENLFRIALGYGLTTEALANLNGINDPASIQVGQRLLVPRDAVGEIAQPDAEPIIPDTEQVAPADSVVAESGEFVLHTVLPGESLFQIALSYGTEVSELASANGILDPTRIFAGQQLIVPGAVPVNFLTDLPEQVSRFVVTPGVFIEGKTGQVTMRTTESAQVTGRFLDSDLQAITLEDGLLHVIFIGIPVFSEAGIYPLQVVAQLPSAGDLLIEAEVQVIGGTYGREVIDLLEGRDDLLNENVEAAEMALLRNAATTFNPERYFDDTMGLPAAAAVTSGFGTRRSYNGSAEFNRFHSGTDFAGAPGSPILAPADGRVVLADTLNVRGNSTMIDHGWGIFTGYWHQTEIYVTPGEFVETGQVIGTIGSTGRVTGAHLHWELWVNGVPVDPMQWVQQPFLTFSSQQDL